MSGATKTREIYEVPKECDLSASIEESGIEMKRASTNDNLLNLLQETVDVERKAAIQRTTDSKGVNNSQFRNALKPLKKLNILNTEITDTVVDGVSLVNGISEEENTESNDTFEDAQASDDLLSVQTKLNFETEKNICEELKNILDVKAVAINEESEDHLKNKASYTSEVIHDAPTEETVKCGVNIKEPSLFERCKVNTEEMEGFYGGTEEFLREEVKMSDLQKKGISKETEKSTACNENEGLGHRPSIPDFFSGRCVFITGATGFMGKVLVEKLLRSCPGIDTLYLLMRPKKDQCLRVRFRELTTNVVFSRVRDRLDKLVPVAGDVSQPDLALGVEDVALLADRISIIFHCAADVRFDEPLENSVLLNTRGTREVARLALHMRKLEALVHVSTAFSNPTYSVVEEKMYPAPADPEQIILLVEQMSHEELAQLQPGLLKDLPNTYVFSKALAEHVIYDMKGKLPVAIFRPSVVCPSYQDPMPGWVDSHHGPMGVLVGASMGFLRTVHGDGSKKADILPVDLGINALITVAWDTALSKHNDVPIYNCTTSSEIDITWNQFLDLGRQLYAHYPSTRAMWYPGGAMHKNVIVHLMYFFLTHLIPALIVDGILLLTRHKTWLVKLQKKMFFQFMIFEYFLLNEWTFKNSNLRGLQKKQILHDQHAFNFDASQLDLYEYVKNWVLGSRRFVLKLDDANIPQAKIQLKRLYWLHCGLQIFLTALLLWFLSSVLQTISLPFFPLLSAHH